MEKDTAPPTHLIKWHNNFIEANYKASPIEKKLLLGLAFKAQRQKDFGAEVEYSAKEISDIAGINSESKRNLDKAVENLMKTIITVRNPEDDKDWVKFPMLGESSYTQGTLKITLPQKMQPFLTNLKERFTKYHLEYIHNLRSEYSIRIYELLKQYETIGSRVFDLGELKEILGCIVIDENTNKITEEKYKLYGHFKAKVLEVARRDLQNYCDIYFSFHERKKGKKVERLEFRIYKNTKNISKTPPPPTSEGITLYQMDIFSQLQELGVDLEKNLKLKEALLQLPEQDLQMAWLGVNELRKTEKPYKGEAAFFAHKLTDLPACIGKGLKALQEKQHADKQAAQEERERIAKEAADKARVEEIWNKYSQMTSQERQNALEKLDDFFQKIFKQPLLEITERPTAEEDIWMLEPLVFG